MNILLLDSIEPQTYGGMEEWIRLVAGGLAQRGHTVIVAGRPGSEFLRRIETDHSGVQILPLEISGDFNPATIARLQRAISDHRIDLLTVNFNKDIRLGGIAARLGRRPRVIWSVGLDITRDSLSHKLLTPRLVDGVIVPSASLKQQITRHGYIPPEIVEVIPIGILDTPLPERTSGACRLREKYNLPGDSLIAVTSGRFVEQKGHRFLIEAAGVIVNRVPNIRFLWLGDGPLETELRTQIAAAGLTPFFVLAGMLRDFELELSGADLMVHPSVEEPFGIVLLEAMRAGLPVVASNIGGIPEVVSAGETALLVTPRDPNAIAEAVGGLAGASDRRRSMGAAGRARFEQHFTLTKMIDRVEQHFLSTISTTACANGNA